MTYRSCMISQLRTAASILALLISCTAAAQQPTYVSIRLPKDVSIELPRNWILMSGNERITLDAAAIAQGLGDFRHDLAFAANYYDEGGKTAAYLNSNYYPTQVVTQSVVSSFSGEDIRNIDSLLQQELQKGITLAGGTLVAWLGTSRQTINGTAALVSEYRSSSPYGSFRTRLVRVLDAGRSFTLNVSYREDHADLLQPISDRIIRSLRR